MIRIVDAAINDIPVIQKLAEETWWPTYSSIVSEVQIRYMLDAIYSQTALENVMKNGSQTFLLLYNDEEVQGFAAFGPKIGNSHVFKLHKLYVLPQTHGKGYGRLLIEEVKRRLLVQAIYTMDLNVNRFNKARAFYEKIGFKVIGEEDVSIGPYWMNDYVMRLELGHQTYSAH
jgi:ribosomal protein S18 acetylase RimI-like enzyme